MPHLDYCSVLIFPKLKKHMMLLESVQRSFTSKICEVKDDNYWTRLLKLKLYSVERRYERYSVIYTWKVMEEKCPNLPINPITVTINDRRGRLCIIPPIVKKAPPKIKTIKDNFFSVRGPRLFNSLPADIRNITSCSVESFKRHLDKYLQTLPDQPTVPGYYVRSAPSNSIIDQGRPSGRGGMSTACSLGATQK